MEKMNTTIIHFDLVDHHKHYTQKLQNTHSFQEHIENSPRYTIYWAIKPGSKNFKILKSCKEHSSTITESTEINNTNVSRLKSKYLAIKKIALLNKIHGSEENSRKICKYSELSDNKITTNYGT